MGEADDTKFWLRKIRMDKLTQKTHNFYGSVSVSGDDHLGLAKVGDITSGNLYCAA